MHIATCSMYMYIVFINISEVNANQLSCMNYYWGGGGGRRFPAIMILSNAYTLYIVHVFPLPHAISEQVITKITSLKYEI